MIASLTLIVRVRYWWREWRLFGVFFPAGGGIMVCAPPLGGMIRIVTRGHYVGDGSDKSGTKISQRRD